MHRAHHSFSLHSIEPKFFFCCFCWWTTRWNSDIWHWQRNFPRLIVMHKWICDETNSEFGGQHNRPIALDCILDWNLLIVLFVVCLDSKMQRKISELIFVLLFGCKCMSWFLIILLMFWNVVLMQWRMVIDKNIESANQLCCAVFLSLCRDWSRWLVPIFSRNTRHTHTAPWQQHVVIIYIRQHSQYMWTAKNSSCLCNWTNWNEIKWRKKKSSEIAKRNAETQTMLSFVYCSNICSPLNCRWSATHIYPPMLLAHALRCVL